MKKLSCLSFFALAVGVCANAATLTHRYDFTDDADDAVGTLNGTLSGDSLNLEAPEFVSDRPTGASTSFASNSIEFGMTVGSSSSVNFGGGAQTEIYDGKAGSVAYWFKADTLANNKDMFSNVGGLRTLMLNDGRLRLAGAGQGNAQVSFATTNVTASTWHHLVVTWDDVAGEGKIALDGDIETWSFTAGDLVDPARLIIANYAPNASAPTSQFDGHIYDLQIYDGVLTDGEIGTLAGNAGVAIPEPGTYALLGGIFALTAVLIRRRGSRACD